MEFIVVAECCVCYQDELMVNYSMFFSKRIFATRDREFTRLTNLLILL